MTVRRISTENKLISLVAKDERIYIGDAGGTLYELGYPFTGLKKLFQSTAPISAVEVDERIYYGNWDGCVGVVGGKNTALSGEMVKCIRIFGSRVYVSVGMKVVILDLNLNVKEQYTMEYKVLAFTEAGGRLYCGMNVPYIARIDAGPEMMGKSGHEMAILCMDGEYTGSADGTVMKQDFSELSRGAVIYKGDEWIRSMHSQHLFSQGRDVIADLDGLRGSASGSLQRIYSHDDNVEGVVCVRDKIVSIGLDYCYYIYDLDVSLGSDEEREIAELLAEC
jgi:hypothetical protein